MSAPISSTPYFSSTPASCSVDGEVERGLPAEGRQQRVRALDLAMTRSTNSGVSGST